MTDSTNGNSALDYDENHVAVVGMSGRYPGAENLEEFWNVIREGKDGLIDLDDSELDDIGIPKSLYQHPDYVKRGSRIPHADCLDAEFFGFIPREAAMTDPQTRVFLETCYEALESAGYDPMDIDVPVGVFAGSGTNDYGSLQGIPDPSDPTSAFEQLIGREKDFLATRVAHKLNLKGPALTLQTACSTSLVAIHLAVQSLLSYESTMSLAGGVTLSFRTNAGYLYQEGMILSPDGRCRAFDVNASGTSLGQGCGVVVLKRLTDAISDRDNILAVIRGSAVNNDGADKIGYTAPSETGQAEVITMAHQLADVASDSIGYVEAHGTGTKLGDPIEIAALGRAFAPGTKRKQYCAIGSVKTNYGHTDTAAGVTGFIKTVLSLYHKKLLPNIHFNEPNPNIGFHDTPFYVNDTLQEWNAGNEPRRAGVSSFGIGGTNAHIVLEEPPSLPLAEDVTTPQLLPFSARTRDSLNHAIDNMHDFLASNPSCSLGDIVNTLRNGRAGFKHRAALVVKRNQEGTPAIEICNQKTITGEKTAAIPKTVWMFSGQGSQYAGMCAKLYDGNLVFSDAIDKCAVLFQSSLGTDIRDLMFNTDITAENDLLSETRFTQPALFSIEYALSSHLMAYGVTPDAVMGHSIGEFAAAVQAGIMSLEDATYVVSKRASLMQSMESGSMLSVSMSEQKLSPLLPEGLVVAVENTPELTVVAGPENLILEFESTMKAAGNTANLVRTSHAFHSPMMNEAATRFLDVMQQITLSPPKIPMTSNISGSWMTPEEATSPEYWANQITSRVKFSQCLSTASQMVSDDGKVLFVETGPGRTLYGLARLHPDINLSTMPICHTVRHASDSTDDQLITLQALGCLWAEGIELNWDAIQDTSTYGKTPLPTYPFARQKHWAPDVTHVMALPQFQSQSNSAASVPTLATASAPVVQSDTGGSVAPIADITNTAVASLSIQERSAYLLELLRSILVDLSGIDADSIDVDSTFVESGFDSLFMTQLSAEVKKRFKQTVTQRQLFENASTLALLAKHLDKELPETEFLPPALGQQNPGAHEGNSLAGSQLLNTSTISHADGNGFIAEQLSFISQQLALLANTSAILDTLPLGTSSRDSLPLQNSTDLTAGPRSSIADDAEITRLPKCPETTTSNHAVDNDGLVQQERYGPWKQINVGQNNAVSNEQTLALSNLISDYVAKTGASKAHTDQFRSEYADPRSIAGFNRLWKEIIYPLVADRSDGARIWDIDGNEYLDVQSGFGSVFLGHNQAIINDAITSQLSSGMLIGPQHLLAGSVAKDICTLTGTQRSTFCNTGSEAVLAAVRVSRTYTGKDKIVMFTQDYHGIFDEVVARRVGPVHSLRTLPAAPGIPKLSVENTIILEYGDPASLDVLNSLKNEVAAVLLEPVQSRRPELQPLEFIQYLRQWTTDNNSVLIFDEVISGFRLHPRGAQGWYDIEADLCTYGKIIGGGLPIGILAGKQHLMDTLDGGSWKYGDNSVPEVGVTYFAGTFVRHPLAVVAANATVKFLMEHGQAIYDSLNSRCDKMAGEINAELEAMQAPLHLQNCGSMMYLEFLSNSLFNPIFFYYLRLNGLFISDYGSFFLTLAHSDTDLNRIKNTLIDATSQMQKHGFFPELP